MVIFQHHQSDWQLEGFDVHFDGEQKLIVVDTELSTTLDIKTGVYAAWKRWMLLGTRDWNKWYPAIRTTGGDPTVAGQFSGDIYFLQNGWRIQHNANLAFTGALFSDDFDTPSIDFSGDKIGLRLVSSLVTSTSPDLSGIGIATSEEVAVLQTDVDNLQTRLPTSLVGGRMDSDVGALQAGAIQSATFAVDAVDASALAASAVTEIQSSILSDATPFPGARIDTAVSSVAPAVLDELLSGHFTPDSLGEALALIRGLVQQNYMVDTTNFNDSGLMTSARFRLFPDSASVSSATDAGTGEGELASYTVEAVSEAADETKLKYYKVKRD